MSNSLKTTSLSTMIDKHIGKRGTARREVFENKLNAELVSLTDREQSKIKIQKKL